MLVFLYKAAGSNLLPNGEGIPSRTKSPLTFPQIRTLFMRTMAGLGGATGSGLVGVAAWACGAFRMLALSRAAAASNLLPNGASIPSQGRNLPTFHLSPIDFTRTRAGPDGATGSGLARSDHWTISFDHSRRPALLYAAAALKTRRNGSPILSPAKSPPTFRQIRDELMRRTAGPE